MSKEKKLAKKEKKALKKKLKLEKKIEKLNKKRQKVNEAKENQVEKMELTKLVSNIKVDKIEQEKNESLRPLVQPQKILIHRSDAKDVEVKDLSKVVLRNHHKARNKINLLNSSNESFNHLKKASSDCDLSSVRGRKMRKQERNEIKSLLYNPMRFSATASQLNLSSTKQSTESIVKKDKCFFESNTLDQKSLRNMKKDIDFKSGRPQSEGFVTKEDKYLITTNSELQISHKVDIKKEYTLDNSNYETKKKKKLKTRKAARSSSIVRLSQKKRNKKRFKVINRLLRRLETKKDEPMMDCRDENEIEEKKASRSRAITALNIMIPEKDKIKRVSSNNDEEPVGTASDEQEAIIQEAPRIKRGRSVLAKKNENRREKKRKRKIRFFKKRKKSIKLSNIQKKEAFTTDQKPPSTLQMENLKLEVDEVTEIVRNSALDLLNQREATLNQALESCERLNETADQFAKITNTIYLKEKHKNRCCGLLPNWRWCWFLCSCKCSPTKCKKKDKKKKAATSEELPEEKQSFRPCSSENSSSKYNENKKVSNMDDELSIYQDEETRERARQLLLLDSE